MKKRISIYIDEEVWKNVKETAWKLRLSASSYLEDLIRTPRERGTPIYGDGVSSTEVVEFKNGSTIEFSKSDPHVGFENYEDAELKIANDRLLDNRKKIKELKSQGMMSGSEIPFRSFPKGGNK